MDIEAKPSKYLAHMIASPITPEETAIMIDILKGALKMKTGKKTDAHNIATARVANMNAAARTAFLASNSRKRKAAEPEAAAPEAAEEEEPEAAEAAEEPEEGDDKEST
jgi:hypothetical protein